MTFFAIFLLGLGLNLTPCVYPMLSVTVSLFTSQKERNAWRSFFLALIYVTGIAVTNTALGVAASLTGGILGSFLQSRLVLLGISFLFLALALSMFGAYSLQMPSWLLNRFTGKKPLNFAGLFFSGMVVGIFAAPCMGPPILALLTLVGTQGDPLFAVKVFLTLSAGLGFPYLILGTSSSFLHKIPRSGPWLVWVEKLFGVILLTLAGFYFILSANPYYLKWLFPLALAGGGIYLGFLERSGNYAPAFEYFRRTGGILAVCAALMLPFLQPRESVHWDVYSSEKLELSKQNHRPVIMDFYADWCIPCHELDQFTYTHPEVIKALEGYDKYKVDLTHEESEASMEAVEKFDILGVPTILFLGPDGKEIKDSRIAGFVSPEEFLEILPSFVPLEKN